MLNIYTDIPEWSIGGAMILLFTVVTAIYLALKDKS